jgi:thioredoxin-like negative regulator of GroEL
LANRSADFNYKVALAEGLKKLQAGRLRQAEEQFRYLVKNFPGAEGGYRGLAKVLVEQEDRAGAMRMLLDGGASLAKADRRENAIALYREAVALDPNDMAAHRRLAVALILAGSQEDAAREFVRYINGALAANDESRAKTAAEYAVGRLPANMEVAMTARAIGVEPPHVQMPPVAPPPARPQAAPTVPSETAVTERAATQPADGIPMTRWDGPIEVKPQPAAPKDPWVAPPPQMPLRSENIIVPPPKTDDPWATPEDVAAHEAAAAPPEIDENADAATVEEAAAKFRASGDPRFGDHAIEAARRYIADGRVDAASDLLLQLVASGVSGHDAQRLLVEVTRTLGKTEVAKTKVKLLIEALRLDGRAELAAEVEQELAGAS